MLHRNSFSRKVGWEGDRRQWRRFVSVLCIVLVCLFAGVSAGHTHALPQAGTALVHNAPCELCAVAFQAAVVLTLLLLTLSITRGPRASSPDPRSKSQFAGFAIYFRPPPSLA
jgi:hypothetical protein